MVAILVNVKKQDTTMNLFMSLEANSRGHYVSMNLGNVGAVLPPSTFTRGHADDE